MQHSYLLEESSRYIGVRTRIVEGNGGNCETSAGKSEGGAGLTEKSSGLEKNSKGVPGR